MKIVKNSRNLKIMLLFLFSGFIFSLFFSRSLANVEADFSQIFTNGFLPLISTYILISVAVYAYEIRNKGLSKYKLLHFFLLALIVFGIVLQHHRDPRYWGHLKSEKIDVEFYEKLDKLLNGSNKRIATIQYFDPPKGMNYFQYNYQLYPLVKRIVNMNDRGIYFPECINVHEMDSSKSAGRKLYYKKSPFIHFMDSIYNTNYDISVDFVQSLFLGQKHFEYLIVPPNKFISDNIHELIRDSIVRDDGLRFYILKFENN